MYSFPYTHALIPHFAAALYRSQYGWQDETPLLLVHYTGGRGRLVACDADAALAGVQIGQSVSRARALCPAARVVLAEPSRLCRAYDHLLESLSQYSQYAEAERVSAQTGVFYLDLGKLRPVDGCALGESMIAACARLGFMATVGLAANKFTARVAAGVVGKGQVQLVRRGEEAAFLQAHSTDALPLDKEAARRFALFGLRTMGDVAHLPRPAMLAQFGREGTRWHKLACGEDARRVGRYTPTRVVKASRLFEDAVENTLSVEACLMTLAAEIMQPLVEQHETGAEIVLTAFLHRGAEREAVQRPREGVGTALALYRVLQALLPKLHLREGVVRLEVQVGQIAPAKPEQLSLFDTPDQKHDPRALLLQLERRYEDAAFYMVTANQGAQVAFHLERLDAA